jgi:hypothetical protein
VIFSRIRPLGRTMHVHAWGGDLEKWVSLWAAWNSMQATYWSLPTHIYIPHPVILSGSWREEGRGKACTSKFLEIVILRSLFWIALWRMSSGQFTAPFAFTLTPDTLWPGDTNWWISRFLLHDITEQQPKPWSGETSRAMVSPKPFFASHGFGCPMVTAPNH